MIETLTEQINTTTINNKSIIISTFKHIPPHWGGFFIGQQANNGTNFIPRYTQIYKHIYKFL